MVWRVHFNLFDDVFKGHDDLIARKVKARQVPKIPVSSCDHFIESVVLLS